MEQIKTLPQIRAALIGRAKVLRELSDQAFHIETQIKEIALSLLYLETNRLEDTRPESKIPNIIPFPGPMIKAAPVKKNKQPLYPFMFPIDGQPENCLPENIPDFRPLLQRDGLILLSWDKRINELGEHYTAYWVTSAGPCRYYASRAMDRRSFAGAKPDHKSYAAEDGIEFYGQAHPCYVVHVAPELMMNSCIRLEQRPEHIKKLRAMGIKSDFDYKYSLTTDRAYKKKKPSARQKA